MFSLSLSILEIKISYDKIFQKINKLIKKPIIKYTLKYTIIYKMPIVKSV